MTVYIRFILNRLGRLGIRKKNAGNTWKQGHKQKIYSYYVLYLYVIIIIKQGTKPVYISTTVDTLASALTNKFMLLILPSTRVFQCSCV